jgi:hypothetical protein
MSSGERNQGIIVTGGTLQADVLAVGPGARAIKNVRATADALATSGREELAERLRALTNAIEAHAGDLDQPAEIAQSAEVVAKELEQPEPNRLTIQAVLGGISQAAGSVVAVAQAAGALGAAIGAIL